MPATLKVTHKAIGAEVRRGTYDAVVDGERAGSVEMNHTIEIPVEPGRHTLPVRNGRNSSSTQTFDAAEEEIVAGVAAGVSRSARDLEPWDDDPDGVDAHCIRECGEPEIDDEGHTGLSHGHGQPRELALRIQPAQLVR